MLEKGPISDRIRIASPMKKMKRGYRFFRKTIQCKLEMAQYLLFTLNKTMKQTRVEKEGNRGIQSIGFQDEGIIRICG